MLHINKNCALGNLKILHQDITVHKSFHYVYNFKDVKDNWKNDIINRNKTKKDVQSKRELTKLTQVFSYLWTLYGEHAAFLLVVERCLWSLK